jgi:hypothetical protein
MALSFQESDHQQDCAMMSDIDYQVPFVRVPLARRFCKVRADNRNQHVPMEEQLRGQHDLAQNRT